MARLLGRHETKIVMLVSAIVVSLVLLGSCTTPSTPVPPIETPPLSPPETSPPEETKEPAPSTTPDPIVNRTTHGRIRWDETWRGEIHIIGDIIVEEGFTLTIEPGTKVLIAANSDVANLLTDPILMKQGINTGNEPEGSIRPGEPYWDEGNHITIQILGTVHAVGTPEQMITITSDSPTPTRYDWNHFSFNNGILSYSIVEHGWLVNAGEGTEVSHNDIKHIGGCGTCVSGKVLIEYNTISDAGHELIGTGDCSPVIRYNNLGPNSKGPAIQTFGSPQIIGNTVKECVIGISVSSGFPEIIDNTIENCERGIVLTIEYENGVLSRDNLLMNNTFSNNEQDIVYRQQRS